ncbi:PHB depolymerase family esterase [Nocardioides sp.]|uniref:extracellular catalytic domain type 1 short-chain-length polyhydroxyalkanoate depolymerase n=1 Tax=Nocardioides sp. TaxID=35761 RepID=UPI00351642D4
MLSNNRRPLGAPAAALVALLAVLAVVLGLAGAQVAAARTTAALAPGSTHATPAAQASSGELPRSRFTPLWFPGPNPTGLTAFAYVPRSLAPEPGVLLVAHGCGTTARRTYEQISHELVPAAEEYGFTAVFLQSPRSDSCFDASTPAALRRDGGGDPQGAASAVRWAQAITGASPSRTSVLGFSSGALLTTVLLAEYPDVFTAGSAFMGAPAGCFAASGGSMWNPDCAAGRVDRTPQEWARVARALGGPLPADGSPGIPRLQLWHGTRDRSIAYANLRESVEQWTTLAGVGLEPASVTVPVPTWRRVRYGDDGAHPAVEAVTVADVGHVLPFTAMVSFALQFLRLDEGQPVDGGSATPTPSPTPSPTPPPLATPVLRGLPALTSDARPAVTLLRADGTTAGIDEVRLWVDDLSGPGVALAPGVARTLDLAGLRDGRHVILVDVWESDGRLTRLRPSVTLDRDPPLLRPTQVGRTLLGRPGGVAAAPGAVDTGSGIASAGCASASAQRLGEVRVVCTASDRMGHRASAAITALVEAAPQLSIGSGARVRGGQPVVVHLLDARGRRLPDPLARVLARGCGVSAALARGVTTRVSCLTYDAARDRFAGRLPAGAPAGTARLSLQVRYPGGGRTDLARSVRVVR